MNFLQPIPNHEEELYVALPAKVKDEFNKILAHLPNILAAKSVRKACKTAAALIGMNAGQLYNRVLKFIETQDWKKLVNGAKAGPLFWKSNAPIGVPVSFQKFYQGLCEKNQRVDMGGYRELMLIWKTRVDSNGNHYERIPGYAKWPEAGKRGYPTGWSYRNLARFAPDEYDSAAARVGPFAASAYRPPVLTTRVGLLFCERVEFDDHEYNLKTHFPGQILAMRPRGFNAAEVLSAHITPTFKPTLWDESEEKKRVLTERDMMWFAIFWLTRVGYRTDKRGTTFVTELGTAAIKQAFAERILRATNGKVKISEPGLFGKPAHKGQFAGRGKGNSKHKALVESSFNLVDNFFAALPGQVGLNRLTAPEELHGRETYFKGLLKLAETLPGERAERIKLPFLTWGQFLGQAVELYQAINANTEHEIEGRAQLGFHALEWRLNPQMPWQSQNDLLRLSDGERAAVEAIIHSSDTGGSAFRAPSSEFPLTRARNLSRQEVFDAELRRNFECGSMTRVSPWRYADLMGVEHGHEVTVGKNSLIEINSREFGMKPIYYLASINGKHLRPGEKFLAFINPWNPFVMLLCKADGAAVGLCQQWETPCKNDEEKVLRMVGQQGHWLAERRAGLDSRHGDTALAVAHMRDHNEAVASGAPVTEQEKTTARNLKKFEGDMTDMVGTSSTSSQTESPSDSPDDFSAEGLL